MSKLNYMEYCFTVSPINPGNEILIAELSNLNFESFLETKTGLNAYIQKKDWQPDLLENLYIIHAEEFQITYKLNEISHTNWNHVWESNFQPIIIDDKCMVRAPFHSPMKNVTYDLVIEPKMSFGTGHHETTAMMLRYILNNTMEDKKVLDMGCGTGVLAILAEKKGAKHVVAIDNDPWCFINTTENLQRNNCKVVVPYEGDAALLKKEKFNTILANINRNILLADMENYINVLEKNGDLFLSGFYLEDLKAITAKCNSLGVQLISNLEENNWVAAHLKKI